MMTPSWTLLDLGSTAITTPALATPTCTPMPCGCGPRRGTHPPIASGGRRPGRRRGVRRIRYDTDGTARPRQPEQLQCRPPHAPRPQAAASDGASECFRRHPVRLRRSNVRGTQMPSGHGITSPLPVDQHTDDRGINHRICFLQVLDVFAWRENEITACPSSTRCAYMWCELCSASLG